MPPRAARHTDPGCSARRPTAPAASRAAAADADRGHRDRGRGPPCYCVAALGDPFDLTEAAWRRRFTRHLAETRGLDRARARAEALALAAELAAERECATAPPTPARRAPSPAQLAQLAAVRAQA